MKCKYCGSEMELMQHGGISYGEYDYYVCMNEKCNATYYCQENGEENWEEGNKNR